MATVQFGNTSVDMRLVDAWYGIPALQNFETFINNFVPVSEAILVDTPTNFVYRLFDAGNQTVTISLSGNFQFGQISSVSMAGAGVNLAINGNFVADQFGNLSGTVTQVRADLIGGGVLFDFTGLSIFFFGDEIFDLDLSDATLFSGTDTMSGGTGNDYLLGYAGNDSLIGGGANDTLDGGSGNDTLSGGAGNDTYIVDSTADVVTEGTQQGKDLVQSGVTYALPVNVENLTLTGASDINGTGNTLANVVTGNAGNNILSGLGGTDRLEGGGGNDTLNGGGGTDTLLGGAGDDVYVVDAVGDVVSENAGEGTDRVESAVSYTLGANLENLTLTGLSGISGTGNNLSNLITGNNGANALSGGSGSDTLLGSGGSDTLEGGNGTDSLVGGGGDDWLDGGGGVDTMEGGGGNDSYVVNMLGETVTEISNQGLDTVFSAVNYTLGSNVEYLVLTGTGNLNGTGNTQANRLTGNEGINRLNGGAGNDLLDGGAGADTLIGGGGNDILVYDATDAIVDGRAGTDTLRMDGGGAALNLSGLAGTTLKNLEVIDLTGAGNNDLTLALADVLDISSSTNTLRVDGNAGDELTATDAGSWVKGGDVVIGLNTYLSYTQSTATLLVDTDITSNLPG